MKTIHVIFGSVLTLLANACLATNITGSIIPPIPEGWGDQGGACIASSLGNENICDYSIGVLETPKELILYLGKSAPRIDPKKARWLVTDQMPYPKIPAGYQVVYSLCERNGESDSTIIAVVKTTETEWYTVIRRAYKANLKTGRFEKTSTKGVRCLNDGWGL